MKKIQVAAMGDLHMQEGILGTYRQTFEELSHSADILVLCGDLTDNGFTKEAEL